MRPELAASTSLHDSMRTEILHEDGNRTSSRSHVNQVDFKPYMCDYLSGCGICPPYHDTERVA